MKKNKIKSISPFYNAEKFIDKCINSVLTQSYDNFDALFIDDCSTDGSFEVMKNMFAEVVEEREFLGYDNIKITEYICTPKRKTNAGSIKIWRRAERTSAAENWSDAILRDCDKEDIVASLDGDDWLYDRNVFQYINEQFQDENLWLMYGGCAWTDGRNCCSIPYDKKDFDNLRKVQRFKISQMRNFRAGLFQKIHELDPELSNFKNKKGEFYTMAGDVALTYPMLEMAGFDRIKHNTKHLYVYNRHSPINNDKVDQSMQWNNHAEVLSKKPFKRIDTYL